MRQLIIIILFSFFIFHYSHGYAQAGKIVTKSTDSLVYHVSAALKKILTIANDSTRDAKLANYNWPKEKSNLDLRRQYFKNNKKTATWVWMTTFENQSTGLSKEILEIKFKRLTRIVDSLYPGKKRDYLTYNEFQIGSSVVSTMINWNAAKNNGTYSLYVSFERDMGVTMNSVIDSLGSIYRPLIFKASTPTIAANIADSFARVLNKNNISDAKITEIFRSIIMEAANSNIKAAFEMLINVSFIDHKSIQSSLSAQQQQTIKQMATEMLSGITKNPVTTPVSENKNWTSPFKSSKENCDSTKKDLGKTAGSYKIGQVFRYTGYTANFRESMITDYDCLNKSYKMMIRKYEPPPKSYFLTGQDMGYYYSEEQSLSFESINKSWSPMNKEYLICAYCSGTGVLLKDIVYSTPEKWVKVDAYSGLVQIPYKELARYTKRIKCSGCYGNGLKEK